jgi:hypothetical protein
VRNEQLRHEHNSYRIPPDQQLFATDGLWWELERDWVFFFLQPLHLQDSSSLQAEHTECLQFPGPLNRVQLNLLGDLCWTTTYMFFCSAVVLIAPPPWPDSRYLSPQQCYRRARCGLSFLDGPLSCSCPAWPPPASDMQLQSTTPSGSPSTFQITRLMAVSSTTLNN